ncbi:MAG: glycosyltransferase family 9 protein [Ignavibacteriaceae bacterium]
MAKENITTQLVYEFFRKIFTVPENQSLEIGSPKKIIIIRQHNQLGDLLAGVSIFRAIKETFPQSEITLLVSPENYFGIVKNKLIDRFFIFDKRKIYNPFYLKKLILLLHDDYDLVIVPVTVSISFTSNLISRFANAKIRIGPKSLDGNENKSAFLFDRRVTLDWRRQPDSNVADRILDIVRPFGINTINFRSEISFGEDDLTVANKFINELNLQSHELLIGIHAGAGKIPNRWSLVKFASLMKKVNDDFPVKFYLTGSAADKEEINYLKQNIPFSAGLFMNKKIPEVAALISKSDLFISNDTGIMHVAGATHTPQISIFGPTNPFNWAPVGSNKMFIRKSELIDDVSVQDVYDLCVIILSNKKRRTRLAE